MRFHYFEHLILAESTLGRNFVLKILKFVDYQISFCFFPFFMINYEWLHTCQGFWLLNSDRNPNTIIIPIECIWSVRKLERWPCQPHSINSSSSSTNKNCAIHFHDKPVHSVSKRIPFSYFTRFQTFFDNATQWIFKCLYLSRFFCTFFFSQETKKMWTHDDTSTPM